MVAGFTAQRPSRRPFLGSTQSGTLCAQIRFSKNFARKSSREFAHVFRVPTNGLYEYDARQFCVAPLPMLIAPTVLRRRRLCFPVAALAALENFGPTRLCYSPQRLSSQPTWLSSLLRVAHGAPVKDSASSWLSWHCSVSLRRLLAPKNSFRLTQ